jgi:carboxyl-terminal processing protease
MKKYLLILAAAAIGFSACHKHDDPDPVIDQETENTYFYVNSFAYSTMKTYYLWEAEIAEAFSTWKYNDEPISKVRESRYKDADGNDIDKWTMLTDSYSELVSSVNGVTTTYGLDYSLYYTDETYKYVCMVVNYTSADSPARKAGLKRGDIIMKVGGNEMSADNYAEVLTNCFVNATECTLTLRDGSTVKMTAVEMYEDPVLLYKTFSFNDKKVGYLVYNSFTLDSWERLIEACKYFKSEGISELILDMRYNSGGYVKAEYTLASMLAPQSAVEGKEIFETEVYNALLQSAYGDDTSVRFTSSFSFSSGSKAYVYSTSSANIGITKLYAIISSRSASASESLLVGLGPYLDIDIIGKQSSGKYCSGIIYPASSWVDDYKSSIEKTENMDVDSALKYTDDWGIYVMVSRFADVNGDTPCMPDGFTPDYEISDSPTQGYELGDENEAMLKAALMRAGKTDFESSRAPLATRLSPVEVSGGSANAYRIFRPEDLPVTVSYLRQYPESQK